MSTDKTPHSPPQGLHHKVKLPTSEEFAQALARGNPLWVTQVWDVDREGDWKGLYYKPGVIDGFQSDTGHYFSCAAIKADAVLKPGEKSLRRNSNFLCALAFVAEDIGIVHGGGGAVSVTGAKTDHELFDKIAPPCSWRIQSSPGNWHYGFRLHPEFDYIKWRRFLKRAGEHRLLAATIKDSGDAVHYFRLPSGINTKKGRGGFRMVFEEYDPTIIYTLDRLAAAFGVDIDTPDAVPDPSVSGAETAPVEVIKAILDLLPNDDWFKDRDMMRWGRVGMSIFGATEASDEGRELWLDWCASWTTMVNGVKTKSPEIDPAKDAKFWDTLIPGDIKASVSTLRRIVMDRYGPDSEEYRKAGETTAQPKAQAAFDPIDDQPGVPTPDKKKLDDLLAAIRATVKVPPHHVKRDYDQHWLPKSGGLLTMRNLAKSPPIAPPVMFEPYVRGGLAVLGGAPSIGKSTLALNQALAVAANRPDLIRDGQGRLQFPGDVIYVSNEDDIGVVERRSLAWAKHHGVDLDKTPFEIALVRTSLLRKTGENKWLVECLDVLQRILDHVKSGREVAMIVVDTLATTVIGADEQQIRDMGEVMRLLEKLAKAFWGSVIFLHHTVKEAWVKGAADQTSRSLATIRGSGGIVGNHTRGATLAVAPDKPELDAHPDWVGRDIVVEYMLKANDGREGYVACYYERVLVDVQQVSATDPNVMETRKEPVLVPISAAPLQQDLKQLQGYLATLRARAGEIRVVEKIGHNGSPNSVQTILGVSNGAAKTIVDSLVAHGIGEVKSTKDKHGKDYFVLELSPF